MAEILSGVTPDVKTALPALLFNNHQIVLYKWDNEVTCAETVSGTDIF
jgi:hypothetical protein